MENFSAPKNSVILCADVASLYPNIPINLGIETVHNVLKDLALMELTELDLVIRLLEYVLKNNYCNFDGINYLQVKGTAMGTPVAVAYSNIFLYGVEKPILAKIVPSFYTRFIDDIYSIFDNPEDAKQFVTTFNAFCPTIKLDAVTCGRKGVMLDLEMTLVNSLNSAYVTHKLYQKERNIYQYIPPISEHRTTLFNNFVLQELIRYRLACTHTSDYDIISAQFATRLKARGYDPSIFWLATKKVPHRNDLLAKLADVKDPSPLIYKRGNLIMTLCVPRLDPPVSWAKIFRIPDIISSHPSYENNYLSPKVIIGSKNPPAIGSYLIRSQFRASPPI
jgi:Reverse transcriptase (RNA-dependent DNA polymerase)